MSEASQAAIKAAEELGLDVTNIVGTGKDGLVTKSDVEAAAETAAKTNIMTAAKQERYNVRTSLQEAVENSGVNDGGIAIPNDDLLEIIKALQTEVTELREAQAGLLERESQSRDLTDDMYFIAKPNGHKWEERRVVDGKTVGIEFTATAFYGPFQTEEEIESYLEVKRSRREDSWIDWQNVYNVKGTEARRIDAEETAEREKHFASAAPVNILDRKIFASKTQGHVPGVGTATADTDMAGAAPFNRSNAAR